MSPALKPILLILFIATSFCASGNDRDTLFLDNGHVIIGEIKLLDGGIITVETDYSNVDFQIEWKHVKYFRSKSNFIIVLSTKTRLNGTFSYDTLNPDYMMIMPEDGTKIFAGLKNIVYLKPSDSKFWDRISANVDAGYDITKASSTTQYSCTGKVSYLYTKIASDVYFNFTGNTVQDTIRTHRQNHGTNWKFFFRKSWYILGATDFLQSDEQNLDLRSTFQIGLGAFIIRNHNLFLASAIGTAFNSEKFTNEETVKDTSIESFAQIELNAYDIKGFNLSSKYQLFPSLSERGRYRSSIIVDLKYKLPLDFYVGFNYSMNYDNQPKEDGKDLDFVFQSTVGWKF